MKCRIFKTFHFEGLTLKKCCGTACKKGKKKHFSAPAPVPAPSHYIVNQNF
jgi:hypothetical protein